MRISDSCPGRARRFSRPSNYPFSDPNRDIFQASLINLLIYLIPTKGSNGDNSRWPCSSCGNCHHTSGHSTTACCNCTTAESCKSRCCCGCSCKARCFCRSNGTCEYIRSICNSCRCPRRRSSSGDSLIFRNHEISPRCLNCVTRVSSRSPSQQWGQRLALELGNNYGHSYCTTEASAVGIVFAEVNLAKN